MLGFFHAILSSADFFFKINFFEKSRVSNSLGADQAGQTVWHSDCIHSNI